MKVVFRSYRSEIIDLDLLHELVVLDVDPEKFDAFYILEEDYLALLFKFPNIAEEIREVK